MKNKGLKLKLNIEYSFSLGHNGDGDVYKPTNISSLEKYVMKMTEGKGVHFVMADGVSSITKCLLRWL